MSDNLTGGRQLQSGKRDGRTETRTIAAGARATITCLGDKIIGISSTADLVLFIDNSGERRLFRTGTEYALPAGEDYTQFALANESGSSITVTFFCGYGTFVDHLTQLTGSISSPDGFRDYADVSKAAGQSLSTAADQARRQIIIRNNSTLYSGRVGASATVGDARGILVPPETTVVLTTAAEVTAYNLSTNAGAITWSVAEIFEA